MDNQQAAILVERGLIEGFNKLSTALQWCWPAATCGSAKSYFQPIKEATIVTYIASALIEKGFFVFNEVNYEGDSSQRLDLLAIHPEYGIELYIEAKGDPEAANGDILGLENDFIRMSKGKIKESGAIFATEMEQPFVKYKFSSLLTTTFSTNFSVWWQGKGNNVPDGKKADSWKRLHKILADDTCKSTWSVPLRTSYQAENQSSYLLHGLYALFER